MIIRIYTYSLPLRLSALPLNEGKQLQTNGEASFKSSGFCCEFSPLKRGPTRLPRSGGDVDRQRGRAIGNYADNHKNNSIQFIRHPEVKSV